VKLDRRVHETNQEIDLTYGGNNLDDGREYFTLVVVLDEASMAGAVVDIVGTRFGRTRIGWAMKAKNGTKYMGEQ
jgi:hypothetical protein